MYTVNHLSFDYPTRSVLHDISVEFPTNKITAIIGPNGCGKSTLLKHLSKSIYSKGTITLNDEPLESIDSSRFAKFVAILSQMHDAMIDDFLVEHIGISHLANEEVQHLSGGELQRAFIAKALTQEPTILLLDEPTNHLDLKYKLALMKELQTFKGTVIVVLHDIQLAATYCDNIVLMNKGRIVKTGSPQEVLTPELLEPVFEIPFTTKTEDGIYRIQY